MAVKVMTAATLGTEGRVRLLREWAEAQLQRNEPGDADHAQRLLQEALAVYEAMNLPKYVAIVKGSLQNHNE